MHDFLRTILLLLFYKMNQIRKRCVHFYRNLPGEMVYVEKVCLHYRYHRQHSLNIILLSSWYHHHRA